MNADISHDRLLAAVRYDRETGVFVSCGPRRGVRKAQPLGHVDGNGYRRIMIDGRRYLAHRLAWFYVVGEWPTLEIDHRNLNRDDNSFCNLRLATTSQNHGNTRASRSGTSGLKGAHYNRFRRYWQSYITVNGRSFFLGRFDNKWAAHEAYVAGAAKHFGQFARAK